MVFLDFQAMYRQAAQARQIAEDMNRLNNVSLQGAASSIAAVWRGEAAQAYLRHCDTTRDCIRKAATELQSIANDMELTARDLEAMSDGEGMAGET